MVKQFTPVSICLAALLLGCISFSYAGIERFWVKQKIDTPFDECDNLSQAQQQELINTYQSLRDEQKKADLKNRILWFCNLPEQEQQRMRLAWQNMSNKERNQVRKKLQTTDDSQERNQIRHAVLEKYSPEKYPEPTTNLTN